MDLDGLIAVLKVELREDTMGRKAKKAVTAIRELHLVTGWFLLDIVVVKGKP